MSRAARVREGLVDQAFAAAWAVTRHAPERVTDGVLARVADELWRRQGRGVTQLEANLRRAVPGHDDAALRELSRQAMRSYFRYWHETFRMPSWSDRRLVDTVVTANEAPLRDGFNEGKGAIIALPHMANWDLAGAWASLTGMPVSTVAEVLKPESLFRRFVSYREGLGMEVIPLNRDVNALAELRRSLAAGRLVCLLTDRDLSGGGVEVELLGEPARMPGGPAMLSRLTGAPMVALSLTYRGPLLHLHFSDVIAVRSGRAGVAAMTQDVANHFTRGIRATPADWHMLQQVFSSDVRGR